MSASDSCFCARFVIRSGSASRFCPHTRDRVHICPVRLSTFVPTFCPQMSNTLSTLPIHLSTDVHMSVHSCPNSLSTDVQRCCPQGHDHVHRCPILVSTDVQASCPHCPCFCPHMSKGGVHICPRWPMLLSTCCPHMSKVAVHYCPQCRDNCGQSILSTVVHRCQRPR